MTDLDAILRAVLADPHDDTPRLVYADELNDLAGVVACPRCGGSGKHDLNPYELAVRYGTHRAGLILDAARCVACDGSGSVSNGLAERAEFVRAQVELARRFPAYTKDGVTELGAGGGPAFLGETSKQFNDLRRRERELWGEYSREWFGDSALWLPTDELRRASPHVPGFVVRRGFVDEWRGPLSGFVGGECGRCGGEGSLIGDPDCEHCYGEGRVTDPDSDDADGMMDCRVCNRLDCSDCRGTGRTPGLDLAAVFVRHPVRRVVLTDREPTAASHPSGAWHWTWAENDADSRVGLPRRLMAALSASGIARVFDSRDAAMDALSLACVNLGRAAAGLDPLT